ncbi:MAG: hypothetical protein AAGI92_09625 [Pseudomonadota bacterium]
MANSNSAFFDEERRRQKYMEIDANVRSDLTARLDELITRHTATSLGHWRALIPIFQICPRRPLTC